MNKQRGFTLIELLIVIVVISILAAVALPSYRAYLNRTRAADAVNTLSQYRVSMEQLSQDNGNYGTAGACAVTVPGTTSFFAFTCTLGAGGNSFVATATGAGSMAGYTYTINELGAQQTTAHPDVESSYLPANCWMIKGGSCS